MKRFFCLFLALACALMLTACGCKHETWLDANCTTPKTCAECGETEGAPLGHSWLAATCETAKTCEICAATEGEALGHAWTDANCDTPMTCATCNLTEGYALGHNWMDATTEAPQTCAACAATEGERIITDPRFTTAATKDLHGTWICRLDVDGTLMDMPDFQGSLPINLVMQMSNDGNTSVHIEIADQEYFYQVMKEYMMGLMYDEFAAAGMSAEEADAGMVEVYGMTTEEYVDYALTQTDFNSLFATFSFNMVYYVEGNLLYTGTTWDGQMSANAFALAGDTLVIENMGLEMGYTEGDLTFTLASE